MAARVGGVSSLRGFGFAEHGGLDRLAFVEVPTPAVGPGEVRVRLRAAAFNRLDRFTLAGIPGVSVDRPHVLGSDGAGVVEELGTGVTDLATGDRVLIQPGLFDGTCDDCRAGRTVYCRNYRIVGEHTQGTVTSRIAVPRRNLRPLPSSLSFEQGAAAPLVFQTAWRALAVVGEVRPGDRVAIVGAGGGVATAAIQVAKLLGATVAVASRAPDKEAKVRPLGADAFLAYDDARPLDRRLWEWSEKRGVDVVFDSVGSPTIPRSIRSLARGGRVVVIGATAGPTAEVDLRTLFWRQASVRGSTMANEREFDQVLAHLSAGRLVPVIDSVHPFEAADAAFRRFDAADLFGKVVVGAPPD